MPPNDTAPAFRQPRMRLLVNGQPIPGLISGEVASNNHYAADRFRAAVALDDGADWTEADRLYCELLLSQDAGRSWASLVQGEADSLDIDPVAGLVHLAGRDLTARLIEARTQESFANRTSSEIAAILAARHGLAADIAPTSTPVGRYWQLEHDRVTLDAFSATTTEWDLLVTLAQHEGFDVWVGGATLHFRPRPQAPSAPAVLRPVATASGPANVSFLRLERALTLAADIEVVVKSWNSRQQDAFVQVARRSRGDAPATGPARKPQRYVYVVPNLTPDDALKLAQARLAELSRHERVLDAEMPGELSLAPRMTLRLEGTGTGFDQAYVIDEIERALHAGHGFTQRVRARNASPERRATSPAARVRGF